MMKLEEKYYLNVIRGEIIMKDLKDLDRFQKCENNLSLSTIEKLNKSYYNLNKMTNDLKHQVETKVKMNVLLDWNNSNKTTEEYLYIVSKYSYICTNNKSYLYNYIQNYIKKLIVDVDIVNVYYDVKHNINYKFKRDKLKYMYPRLYYNITPYSFFNCEKPNHMINTVKLYNNVKHDIINTNLSLELKKLEIANEHLGKLIY